MVASERHINYLNKDFNKFREQLIEFSKNYFPDTYTDFSPTSPGMMFMEMAAYVGDILAFYQDTQVQETFLQYAKNPVNIYAMAYMMGYRPKVTTVAETELTIYQELPAVVGETGELEPDWSKACVVGQESKFKSDTAQEITFMLREPLQMYYSSSNDPTQIQVSEWNGDDPSKYVISKKAKIFSGEIKEKNFTVGEYEKFRTLALSDKDIVGIFDIVDSNGNHWTEVPFLGQDTVFIPEIGKDQKDAQYVLKLEKVDRRFVTRFTDKGELQIQFGAGMYACDKDEKEFLPSPTPLLDDPQTELTNKGDISYDPSNFLFSKSYGLVPINTTLTVRYIVGGGVRSNVPANTITKHNGLELIDRDGNGVDPLTITFTNEKAADGGRNGDTLEEVRQNSLRSFAEQKRVVTLSDYNIRALAMPTKYGNISKAFAIKDLQTANRPATLNNPLAISLYVLSLNSAGKLDYAKTVVKENLRKYLSKYMLLTDAVDIKDAFIVNVGINYDIVLRPDFYSTDVLAECNSVIADYFTIDKRSINETINLSDLYTALDAVRGVQTVKNIELVNLVGNDKYSKYAYDIKAATRNNVIYPSYDPCIFELRYPDTDIRGRVVTL